MKHDRTLLISTNSFKCCLKQKWDSCFRYFYIFIQLSKTTVLTWPSKSIEGRLALVFINQNRLGLLLTALNKVPRFDMLCHEWSVSMVLSDWYRISSLKQEGFQKAIIKINTASFFLHVLLPPFCWMFRKLCTVYNYVTFVQTCMWKKYLSGEEVNDFDKSSI